MEGGLILENLTLEGKGYTRLRLEHKCAFQIGLSETLRLSVPPGTFISGKPRPGRKTKGKKNEAKMCK